MEISARNQLRGRVRAVTLGDVMADVTIEIGSGEQLVRA